MKLYPERGLLTWTTQRLPFNLYCKYRFVSESEVLATAFVAEHSTIPVPRILDVVDGVTDDGLFVLMTQVPGVQVGKAYTDMDERARELMKEELCGWMNQLRSLPVPPSLTISNFLGGPCKVDRIASSGPIGPFSTVEEAHELILSHVVGDERDQVLETARRRSYSKRHRICFTHGDLRPWNVLVKDGRLSGLVDFGSSGWYPEYWEHATATWGVPQWWRDAIMHGFPQYQEEIEVEDIIFSVDSTHPEMW